MFLILKLKIFICLSTCVLCQKRGYNMDMLVAKADIFYSNRQFGEINELKLENVEDLSSKQEFKIIIHGYLGNRYHSSIKPLGNAYLSKGTNNILLADWSDAANLEYHSSRKAVGKVALHYGQMLNEFMSKHEIEPSAIHILGHSLGAHLAGDIGKYFNGTLGRITGLDPALPLFTPLSKDALQSTDAQFVDVVHTDFPVFGDLTPRGTADFYPNFGVTPQKGCDEVDLIAASKFILEAYSCSHNRAVILYAESVGIPKSFPGIPCSFSGISQRNVSICQNTFGDKNLDANVLNEAFAKLDDENGIYMGEHVSKKASGYYYLQTYDVPPYGLGAITRVGS